MERGAGEGTKGRRIWENVKKRRIKRGRRVRDGMIIYWTKKKNRRK